MQKNEISKKCKCILFKENQSSSRDVNLIQKQNSSTSVFEQTKTTVYLKEDLDNHCFIMYFFEGIINLTLLVVCHPTPLL